MTRPRHLAAALFATIAIVAGPASAEGNPTLEDALETANTAWTGTVDIALLRPLSAGRLAMGAFVAMPLSSFLNAVMLPIGQDPGVFAQDWDRFVVEPAEYLFVRPVGEDLAGL